MVFKFNEKYSFCLSFVIKFNLTTLFAKSLKKKLPNKSLLYEDITVRCTIVTDE